MAAKNENVPSPRGIWTTLNDSAITAATVENLKETDLILMATSGATPPADGNASGIRLKGGQGIKSSDTLAVLFPGVTSPDYIHSLSLSLDGEAFISHA